MIQPSGYQTTGSLYAKKTLPTVADNLSKVLGTHTMKFGFYWEGTTNNQPASNASNGQLVYANWGGNTTGNAYADMLAGRIANYNESNGDPILIMKYTPVEFYAQFLEGRAATLDLGLRFSHGVRLTRAAGPGCFRSQQIQPRPHVINTLPGVEWPRSTIIPLSYSQQTFYLDPRFGMASDPFGTGKQSSAGWGEYRFHDEQNVRPGAGHNPW
jgi:hypothetical protein